MTKYILNRFLHSILVMFTISFIVSPLTILNQVNKKNKLGMQWQIGLLFLYMSILYISSYLSFDFITTLQSITFFISCYYLFFLYLIYNHSKETDD